LLPRLRNALLLGGLVAAGAGGVALGALAGREASEPGTTRVVVADPAAAQDLDADAARSPGGFTGFDGPRALAGSVFQSGTVERVADGELTIAGDGGTIAVRFTSPQRLFRIQPIVEPLATGDAVLVRVEGGVVTAVLRVPPDLEEGAGSAP
jgi:hypothetical protein